MVLPTIVDYKDALQALDSQEWLESLAKEYNELVRQDT
jgi:hypothetical protein